MKPTVEFYILNVATAEARWRMVCQLIEKAYHNRRRVYVNADNQADAHQLDELLWTYRDDSFLPHNLYGEGPEPAPPIQIGYQVSPEKHRDILINLQAAVPEYARQFARIIEVVPTEPTIQAQCREHYKYYRQAGFDISTHKFETAEHHG